MFWHPEYPGEYGHFQPEEVSVGGIWLSNTQDEGATREWSIDAMHIKTPVSGDRRSAASPAATSRRSFIGRWLLTEPEVLLLDEPTRGIDVGAKYEIYQLIHRPCQPRARPCIMVSSEMPELLGVCDRILVMSGGQPGR